MEKHCVSLELAKKLKEAGWKKETEFWWCSNPLKENGFAITQDNPVIHKLKELYSAPLATELLEELPEVRAEILIPGNGRYEVSYCKPLPCKGTTMVKYFVDKSLPNALAKMWLYLNSPQKN